MQTDKKQAILHAALEEFFHKGYLGASTNQIIKAAGVSKGILFHYFTDKRNLYLTVIDECMNYYFQALTSHLERLSNDLFEAIEQLSKIKMEIFRSDPVKYGVIAKAFMTMPEEVRKELTRKQQQMNELVIPLLAAKIDRSCFRKEISPEQAIEFVLLSLEALVARQMFKLQEGADEIEGVTAIEINQYVDMLKYGVYRREANE